VDNQDVKLTLSRGTRIAQFWPLRKSRERMKAMQWGKGRRCNAWLLTAMPVAALAFAVLGGGCSTSVRTPLPDLKPTPSTAMSQEEAKKAVSELNKVRVTHEQDAEQQIEQSR
jgi:predicted exporter